MQSTKRERHSLARQLPAALGFLGAHLGLGRRVLVHCGDGGCALPGAAQPLFLNSTSFPLRDSHLTPRQCHSLAGCGIAHALTMPLMAVTRVLRGGRCAGFDVCVAVAVAALLSGLGGPGGLQVASAERGTSLDGAAQQSAPPRVTKGEEPSISSLLSTMHQMITRDTRTDNHPPTRLVLGEDSTLAEPLPL